MFKDKGTYTTLVKISSEGKVFSGRQNAYYEALN